VFIVGAKVAFFVKRIAPVSTNHFKSYTHVMANFETRQLSCAADFNGKLSASLQHQQGRAFSLPPKNGGEAKEHATRADIYRSEKPHRTYIQYQPPHKGHLKKIETFLFALILFKHSQKMTKKRNE